MIVEVRHGDCLSVMREMPDASVDAIVTDPPYGLSFMGKGWDHGVPGVEFWIEALRVAKPGAHLCAFGGTRTFHRLACAIEDAGWEVRDCLSWLYGSGFPKSLDVSKAIDKVNGETDHLHAAKRWHGWGTALKPAWEPIILARKPLVGTVASNVLRHGTGGINVDGCRVPGAYETRDRDTEGGASMFGMGSGGVAFVPTEGRWPANVVLGCACDDEHDEDCAVRMLDEQSGYLHGPGNTPKSMRRHGTEHVESTTWGGYSGGPSVAHDRGGGASRFFYCAKASRSEREAGLQSFESHAVNDGRMTPIDNAYQRGITQRKNTHPTVKPLALMQWLVRLVTPPGGLVLDPFAGSGTTGAAARAEGVRALLIEREAEYVSIARARTAAPAQITLDEVQQ